MKISIWVVLCYYFIFKFEKKTLKSPRTHYIPSVYAKVLGMAKLDFPRPPKVYKNGHNGGIPSRDPSVIPFWNPLMNFSKGMKPK